GDDVYSSAAARPGGRFRQGTEPGCTEEFDARGGARCEGCCGWECYAREKETCLSNDASSTRGPQLRRALTLWDLLLYGIIVLQPVAPMSAFGALSDRGHGHVVTAILIAMVAMLCTAVSYGRMARVYPSAGSAFTYVAREIYPAAGYVTGGSMVMDYIDRKSTR